MCGLSCGNVFECVGCIEFECVRVVCCGIVFVDERVDGVHAVYCWDVFEYFWFEFERVRVVLCGFVFIVWRIVLHDMLCRDVFRVNRGSVV